jgi:AraC family transcriptional regulator
MKKWFYLAGSFARSVEEVPPHLAIKHVPASEWFAFRHVGPLSTLGATYREAYGNAIPESGYEPWLPIDFELYGKEFRGVNDPSSVTEIWIPVRKKK